MARGKMVRGKETPAQAAAFWSTGMSLGQNAYANGVAGYAGDWAAKTAGAAGQWQSALQAAFAAQSWQRGVNAAGTAGWKTGVKNTGVARFAAAGATGQAHYAAWLSAFIIPLQDELNQLDSTNPRGTLQQNIARSAAFINWMAAQRGKYKKAWRPGFNPGA